MYIKRIVAPQSAAEFTDRFQEGKTLDIADRTANLDDEDIVPLTRFDDTLLNLIGNMGNNLNGFAQIVSPPLFFDHGRIDLAGCEVVLFGEVDI